MATPRDVPAPPAPDAGGNDAARAAAREHLARIQERSSGMRIAGSALWQMASQIVMAALSIVTTKLVVLALSQQLAGNYNTAYGYLQIFGILADFSLYAVGVREVSRTADPEKRERVLGTLLTLRCLTVSLSLGIALLWVWIAPAWRGTPLPLAVSIAAMVPGFTLLAGTLRIVFQVEYKLHFVFLAEVAQRVLTVSLTAALVWMGIRDSALPSHLYALLGIGGLGSGLLLLLSLVFSARYVRVRPRWDPPLLRSLFLQAAPYGAAFLCTALYRQSDVTLIATLRPDYEIQNAYYGFVQRMMDMAYILPTFVLNSTLPALAARDSAGEDTRGFLGKTFAAIALLSTTALLFATLWPSALTELTTRSTYLGTPGHPGSDDALRLLGFSMFLNGFVLFGYYCLLNRHAWRPLVKSLCLGGVFSVGLNLLLIPRYGFIGASITSICTHALLAALLLPQSLKTMPVRLPRGFLPRWLGYAVLLAAWLLALRPLLSGSLATAALLGLSAPAMAGMLWGLGLRGVMRGEGK